MSEGRAYKGIPREARTTAEDKRAMQGRNITEQNRRATEQYQAKYGLTRAQVKQAALKARNTAEWAHKAMKEGPADAAAE